MNFFSRWHIFQKTAAAVFVMFMGLLVLVVIVAHSRPSGSTRQDMAKIQLQRKEAEMNQKTDPIDRSAEIAERYHP